MTYEFIITEKPAAAQKIALALADAKPAKKSIDGVPYYEIKHKGRQIVIGSAVGHVYTLAEKEKKFTYPSFDIEWKESSKVNKAAKYTAKYVKAIKFLAGHADTFTVATDYDIEGEVIGLNVIRYICKQKDANRMKFSTLTKPDLQKSYDEKMHTLDWGQAIAGVTRHELDWYYGINLSRALSSAIKKAGMFKILSIGRVQGPALKIVVDREREIAKFVAKPYWEVELDGKLHGAAITAMHEKDRFWDEAEAKAVVQKTKGKDGAIADIQKRKATQAPPHPFDLTSLQVEAYKLFKTTPKKTLEIAQELYTAGYISYPRTSSQQLPPAIGYEKIIKDLGKNPAYAKYAAMLEKKDKLAPNNGKKTDPAHPAIYPTGIKPEGMEAQNSKVYDLIVKRFFSTFGDESVRETVEYHIGVEGENFIAKGTRTVVKGWHDLYEPYVKLEEQEMPKGEKGDPVKNERIRLSAKETQPPNRFTQASLIRALEKHNLGTKATRAQVIDTLYQRGYVDGKQIRATEFGIKTIETLEAYAPTIVDEQLTRDFEEDMERISEEHRKSEEVIKKAKTVLTGLLDDFQKKEKSIGERLLEANRNAVTKANTLGTCPVCNEGDLVIRKGRYGLFVTCSDDECKTTFNIPKGLNAKPADKQCESCGYPMISAYRNKRKEEYCINPECPAKQPEEKPENAGKPCPKCGKGTMVVKKGIYGSFLACDQYPKCKNTERIGAATEREDPYL